VETYLVSYKSQCSSHKTHALVGDSESWIGNVLDAEMWTTVAICSATSTLSLGDIVTSVLRVTYDLGPNGCMILSELVVDSAVVQMESVFRDRPVDPENTDSSTLKIQFETFSQEVETYRLRDCTAQHQIDGVLL
jgi:hypothetical protein